MDTNPLAEVSISPPLIEGNVLSELEVIIDVPSRETSRSQSIAVSVETSLIGTSAVSITNPSLIDMLSNFLCWPHIDKYTNTLSNALPTQFRLLLRQWQVPAGTCPRAYKRRGKPQGCPQDVPLKMKSLTDVQPLQSHIAFHPTRPLPRSPTARILFTK